MSQIVTGSKTREKYAKHQRCPDCSERAIRECVTGFSRIYGCDACLSEFSADEYDLKLENPVPVEDTYEKVIADNVKEGEIDREIEKLSDGSADLTQKQKSKKNLSRLFYAGAFISAITIVGIPLALVLAVLGAYVSPDTSE